MNPRDFNLVAFKLANGKIKAEFRSSISRAYYAAHNVGVEFIRHIGFELSTLHEAHQKVIDRLSNSKDIELQKVGSQLSSLRGDRIKADYRLDNTDIETQKKAKLAVSQASRLIDALDTCKVDHNRKKTVVESIQDYIERIESASKTPSGR